MLVPLCRLCSMTTIFQPPAEGGAKRPIVVAASMCADYLHVGHINLLEHAASQGPVTVLLMTDDGSTTSIVSWDPNRPTEHRPLLNFPWTGSTRS